MPNRIDVSVTSTAVQARYNQLHRPLQALSCSWIPQPFWRDSTAHVIRIDRGSLLSGPATWGRSGRDGDGRYLDSSSPHGVWRGLVAATSFEMTEVNVQRPWEARTFKVSLAGEFFMIGVSLSPEAASNAEFSVLMQDAGPDLRAMSPREPAIVPPSKWSEWITHGPHENLWFPKREGTFSFAEV